MGNESIGDCEFGTLWWTSTIVESLSNIAEKVTLQLLGKSNHVEGA